MSNPTDLVARYIALWNEADDTRRRDLIARTWTPAASYVDPLMRSEGHAGIDAMIRGVQERFPDFRFSQIGNVDTHNDRIRFSWALGPEGGEALVKGTDFGEIAEGERFSAVTGFIDQMPATPAAG